MRGEFNKNHQRCHKYQKTRKLYQTRIYFLHDILFLFCRENWKIDGPYDDPDGWLNKCQGLKENSLQYAVQKVFVIKTEDNRLCCFVDVCTKRC